MTPLPTHLTRLGRALREHGARVSLSDEVDALSALALVEASERDEVYRALRVSLKIQPKDLAVFDALFDAFWAALTEELRGAKPQKQPWIDPDQVRVRKGPSLRPLGGTLEQEVPAGEQMGWSPEQNLRAKAFEECTAADLAAMEKLMARLAERLATRQSRRLVPTPGRGVADLRRSLRLAVAQGGEPLNLARKRRKIERPRLVVLCDNSGSMDPHARFLLAFVLALAKVARPIEIFAFNTRLVRLTPWLKPGRVELTLARLAASVPDWSGGTRIGESLAAFAEYHLDTLVNARTVVLILSDGLDRGDVTPLADALRRIRSRARRVVWLNPLAGDERYEPTARAMAAALPHLDHFLPAHNLESLARLVPLLSA